MVTYSVLSVLIYQSLMLNRVHKFAAFQIPVEDEEKHLSQKHRFEMVWSRTRSLEKIDFVTQPSKDSGEFQDLCSWVDR